MRVLADFFLRALAMEFVIRRQDPRVQIKLRRVTSETSLVVNGQKEHNYFLRKRSSRTTSPPPAAGFSDFSRLAAGAGGRADVSVPVVAGAAAGAAGNRFFLLVAARGSCTFAGGLRSSPSMTSSNCRPRCSVRAK